MSRENTIDLRTQFEGKDVPKEEEMESYIKRVVAVLDRGGANKFYIPNVPNHLHYEWHPDDPVTHNRLIELGFVPNDELAKQSAFIHMDGNGNPRIGDVRLYTISKERKAIIDRVYAEKSARNADPRKRSQSFEDAIKSEFLTPRVTTTVNKVGLIEGE
jgi:hypothetical protein